MTWHLTENCGRQKCNLKNEPAVRTSLRSLRKGISTVSFYPSFPNFLQIIFTKIHGPDGAFQVQPVGDNVHLVIGAKADPRRLTARLAGRWVSNWSSCCACKVLSILHVDVHAVIVHKGRTFLQYRTSRCFYHHRAQKLCRYACPGLSRAWVHLHSDVSKGTCPKPVWGVVTVELLQPGD